MTKKTKIQVIIRTCKRCKEEWPQRGKKRPIKCPRCGTPYWDLDPVYKKQEKQENVQEEDFEESLDIEKEIKEENEMQL